MTNEEIIAIAQKADIYANWGWKEGDDWEMVRDMHFANLVAEATKEKAAKVCEENGKNWNDEDGFCFDCAAAIRSME